MRIKINIISDEQKLERKTEYKVGMILRTGFSVFLSLVILSAILAAAQIALNADYSFAKEDSKNHRENFGKDIEQGEKFLASVNMLSQKILKTSSETPRWSQVIARIADASPADIRIAYIRSEKEHLKIGGFAKTREAFLDFQNRLKGDGFSNIISPVSNVVSPKDFDFLIELDVDKKYLNQS